MKNGPGSGCWPGPSCRRAQGGSRLLTRDSGRGRKASGSHGGGCADKSNRVKMMRGGGEAPPRWQHHRKALQPCSTTPPFQFPAPVVGRRPSRRSLGLRRTTISPVLRVRELSLSRRKRCSPASSALKKALRASGEALASSASSAVTAAPSKRMVKVSYGLAIRRHPRQGWMDQQAPSSTWPSARE